MLDIEQDYIFTYADFVERENAFKTYTLNKSPRRYLGSRAYLRELLTAVSQDNAFLREGCLHLSVTSNPRDWLTYRTVQENLSMAEQLSSSLASVPADIAAKAADIFDIAHLLKTKVSHISLGEAAKVAMAKCWILRTSSRSMCMASPIAWLSHKSMRKLEWLHENLTSEVEDIKYFVLDGELDDGAVNFANEIGPIQTELAIKKFRLDLSGLEVDRECFADYGDFDRTMQSPCLIQGDNGSGKSLLCKALARAIPFDGSAYISSNGTSGLGRVVFQDIYGQILSRSWSSFQRFYKQNWSKVAVIYHGILKDSNAEALAQSWGTMSFGPSNLAENVMALPQMKALVASVRLSECERRNALILDEPSWGLSKTQAVCLLAGIVKAAHERGIPVFVVSHRGWWDKICASVIRLEKEPSSTPSHLYFKLSNIR